MDIENSKTLLWKFVKTVVWSGFIITETHIFTIFPLK